MEQPAIETYNLSIGYSSKQNETLLNSNLELSLYPGEVTALLGINGAGKSTLLRTIAGFLPPLKGEIRIMGRNRISIPVKELSRSIGIVLTDKSTIGTLKVFDLVSLGRHPYTDFFGRLRTKDYQIIKEAMQRTGIEHKAESYVGELSDGERQKAMIAKALAQECPIILLDEPTAFLDVTSRIELMLLLRELATSENKSILLSTHDIELALTLSDQLWLLKKYEGVKCGTPEDLVLDNTIASYFAKESICFDILTGRLNYVPEGRLDVFIESEGARAFWLANAVKRCGLKPVESPSDTAIRIKWTAEDTLITLQFPNGKKQTISTVGELTRMIKHF